MRGADLLSKLGLRLRFLVFQVRLAFLERLHELAWLLTNVGVAVILTHDFNLSVRFIILSVVCLTVEIVSMALL